MTVLVIRADLVDAMVAHARADHPDEACGVLAGPEGSDRPERHIAMLNAERSPTFYRFDSMEQLKVWRALEDADEVPVVIYRCTPRPRDLLKRGAARLGIPAAAIMRNVNGCWNLGYCGMGCPTNAKQSMLVTTIFSALDHGAGLLTHARAEHFVFNKTRWTTWWCARSMQPAWPRPGAR